MKSRKNVFTPLLTGFGWFVPIAFLLSCVGCGGGATAKVAGGGGGGGGGEVQTPFVIGIEIQPQGASLNIDQAVPFTATAVYTDGTTQDVTSSATWSSSTSAATVNGNMVTGAAQGRTVISLTSNGVTGYTIVSVGAQPSGGAPNYYVSPTGSDTSNDGLTPSTPFATLNHARAVVAGRPGTVVQFAAGTYYNTAVTFGSSDSGTATSPIIYEAAPGAKVVFSGGIPVTGWVQSGTTATWTASLNSATMQNFEGLFYQPASATDMERRSRPRTSQPPPGNKCVSSGCPGYLFISSGTPSGSFTSFQFNGSDVAPTYHAIALGDVEVLDFENWSMSRLRLLSVSGNTATTTSSTFQGDKYGFFAGHRYLIENCSPAANDISCPALLGQWYLDRCPNASLGCTTPQANWTLYYYKQSGEDPSADTVIVPQQTQLITANSASYIVFNGITFSNDNWYPGNPAVSGQSCTGPCGLGDTSGSPDVSAALSFTNATGIIFNQCTFSHTDGWGLEFLGASAGNSVVNSSFYDIGGGAVRIGAYPAGGDADTNTPQYNLIENNLISGIGRVQPTGIGTGVWIGNAHQTVVSHNQINDVYSGGIGVGFSSGGNPIVGHDNIISYNLMYDLGQGVTSDMGGIHSAAAGAMGNQMLNNVMHNINFNFYESDAYGAHGLYLDQSSAGVVAHNNLAYNLGTGGVFNNLGGTPGGNALSVQNNVILNNVFSFLGVDVIQRGGNIPYSFSFVQNIAYFDLPNVAIQGGAFWSCASSSNCTTDFFFNNNDYFDTTQPGSLPSFFTTMGNGGSMSALTFSQWQGVGEDAKSISVNPGFSDPTSGAPSGFTIASNSPVVSKINFVPFDPTQAGIFTSPQASFSTPPAVPSSVTCSIDGTPETFQAAACPAFPWEIQTTY